MQASSVENLSINKQNDEHQRTPKHEKEPPSRRKIKILQKNSKEDKIQKWCLRRCVWGVDEIKFGGVFCFFLAFLLFLALGFSKSTNLVEANLAVNCFL